MPWQLLHFGYGLIGTDALCHQKTSVTFWKCRTNFLGNSVNWKKRFLCLALPTVFRSTDCRTYPFSSGVLGTCPSVQPSFLNNYLSILKWSLGYLSLCPTIFPEQLLIHSQVESWEPVPLSNHLSWTITYPFSSGVLGTCPFVQPSFLNNYLSILKWSLGYLSLCPTIFPDQLLIHSQVAYWVPVPLSNHLSWTITYPFSSCVLGTCPSVLPTFLNNYLSILKWSLWYLSLCPSIFPEQLLIHSPVESWVPVPLSNHLSWTITYPFSSGVLGTCPSVQPSFLNNYLSILKLCLGYLSLWPTIFREQLPTLSSETPWSNV